MRTDEHVIAQLDRRIRHRGRPYHGLLGHDRVRADLDTSSLGVEYRPVHDPRVRTYPYVPDKGGVGRDVCGRIHDRRRVPVSDQHAPIVVREPASALA